MRSCEKLDMDALCERVSEKKKTLIVFHERPDGDAVGSAFALRELLHAMGIPVMCVCADEIPDRLRFITDGVQGSVLVEEGMVLDHERVISVDSAAPDQLGSLFPILHRDIALMIDHHEVGFLYADSYIDPTVSATGEIIYLLAKELVKKGKLEEIPHRVYLAVYAAICADTGCFRYSNVTPTTFRIAAELLETGVNAPEICRRLCEEKSLKQLKAEGEAARRLFLYDGGRIASVTFPYQSKYSLGLSDEHLSTVMDVPRSVVGVEIAVVVKQPEQKNVFRVSLRSNSELDVSAVAAGFGGGGHQKAAGCTIEADGIDDAEKMILRAIRERL